MCFAGPMWHGGFARPAHRPEHVRRASQVELSDIALGAPSEKLVLASTPSARTARAPNSPRRCVAAMPVRMHATGRAKPAEEH